MKKRLPLIASILAAAAVLIIAAVIYDTTYSLTKADYGKAAAAAPQLLKLQQASAKATQGAINPDSSNLKNTDGASSVTLAANTALTTYTDAVKAFDSQHALHDAAIKTSYNRFKSASDAYVNFTNSYLNSTVTVGAATSDCKTAFTTKTTDTTFQAYLNAANLCLSALNAKPISDPDLKTFATAYIDFINSSLPIYQKIYQAQGESQAEIDAQTAKLTPLTDTFTAKSKAANADITTRYKALPDITAAYNSFMADLNKKV